ncbi:MAG: molybdopterin-synthase adenylyltransferase MoeB [Gammaproteobacteria bacterium]
MSLPQRLEALRREIAEIAPAEVPALRAKGACLIDIREPEETADGAPDGALLLPRGRLELEIGRQLPDATRPLLLLCGSGVRSLLAAPALRALGYADVRSVAGGFARWKAEGLPCTLPSADARWRQRYARQIVLPELGVEGQRKLGAARVLLVGAGGLGSPCALYLAGAGIGTLGLVDADVVERSNLHRQVLHTDERVGEPKVDSARRTLAALNPDIRIHPHRLRLDAANVEATLRDYDVIVDGSDNFPTRYLVSDACVRLGKPNVYAAVQGFEGQVAVFPAGGRPCYRCLFAEPPPPELAPPCSEAGVLGVLPGILGLLQALAVLNLLLGFGDSPLARLQLFDGRRGTLRSLRLAADPACSHCAPGASFVGYADPAVACAGRS